MKRFFCFCAGTKWSVLKQCPSQIPIYTSMGVAVLLTALLATISGTYAIYMVFGDYTYTKTHSAIDVVLGGYNYAIVFGLVWGLTIFNLDRLIVMSMRKKEQQKWWRQLLKALPRLILAVFIGLVVSKPLEVRLFKDQLDFQLELNKYSDVEKPKSLLETQYDTTFYNTEIQDNQSRINQFQNEIKNPTSAKYEQLISELANREEHYSLLNQTHPQKIQHYRELVNRYIYPYRSTSQMPNSTAAEREKIELVRSNALKRNAFQKELSNAENEVVATKLKIDSFMVENQKKLEREILLVEDDITQTKEDRDSTLEEKSRKIHDLDASASIGNGKRLMPYIKALGDLIKEEEKRGESTMWWSSLLITLLFISIESAPVLSKLLLHRTKYDELLETKEREEGNYAIDEANMRFSHYQSLGKELNSRREKIMNKALERITEEKWGEELKEIDSGEDLNSFYERVMQVNLSSRKKVGVFMSLQVIVIGLVMALIAAMVTIAFLI